jgi:intein/homing endonuclease
MASKINEIIEGSYNHLGKSIIYGDSVTGDTMIRTESGDITIKQLFDECIEHAMTSDGKEYGLWNQSKVIGFNGYEMEPVLSNIETVMRHKTKKKLYRITTENNKSITVTEDHSIMVDRDGLLIEVKPTEILENDIIITLAL